MKTIFNQAASILLITFLNGISMVAQSPELKPKYVQSNIDDFFIVPGPQLMLKTLTFEFKPVQADLKYEPKLIIPPSPNRSEIEESYIDSIKQLKDALKNNHSRFTKNAEETTLGPNLIKVGNSFYADIDGSCPNDNTIAISKAGKIISMMNQYVGIYTTNGKIINIYDLESFFGNYMNSGPCDPKVEYDPVADRFFMFLQDCNENPENIAFGFSKTNDPNGSWWIYVFDSDALQDGSWSDYPKVAINSDEIFITTNLYGRNGGSYKQSILYQLNKQDGYSGKSLHYKIWTGFQSGTILPIRSGDNGQYGPGIYCIQTNAGGSSSFNYYDITGSLSDPNSKLLYKKITTTAYEPSGNAYQKSTSVRLDIGDCRCMDGYYQNGLIHFVFAADDEGYSGIRYHRLDPVKLDGSKFEIFSSSDEKDYAYPSISPFNINSADNSSVIHFAASGENFYPEMRAKLYHSDFSSDPSIQIKQGPGPQTSCYNSSKGYARWGDYSGAARMYNSTVPTCWVAGSVGNDINGRWWTYIAELISTPNAVLNLSKDNSTEIYPNPLNDRMTFEIQSSDRMVCYFNILTSDGKKVSELFYGSLHPGINNFSFSTSYLQPGQYFLQVVNNNQQIIKNEKFIVAK
ncbi:MAG: T9SS type A sorting domain-containing protein [Saprospiraceae bacterium]|nr:T9SS type A sorting domain-containing protein [Saprospiraceae bacterium]HMW38546.1 T9SS type A sorting domain-containing protein [Saprospiraceae bacterium]HMX88569.1 T9SS type A sorting domain-containing protein [Saprospiraceae bacterium]HMZ40649.1 T9SS type A sorting domain-containing protein [Saprospiraceae bacterium]HNA63212.1 T9SS type A sorting domain-containing protein [Saprospiraceae bacterium]